MSDNRFALRWLPKENRWEIIEWDDWMVFLSLGNWAGRKAIDGATSGIHYFVVCFLDNDDEERRPVNLIAHKYKLDEDGKIEEGSDLSGFTPDEHKEHCRLLCAMDHSPEDKASLEALRWKLDGVFDPPRESARSLLKALPKPPIPGRGAAGFIAKLIGQS